MHGIVPSNDVIPQLLKLMKKAIRSVAVVCLAALLGACTSPYQAQMGSLYNSYRAGYISEQQYREEMARLQYHDAGWQQQQANAATTAAVVGAAAIGTAVLLDNHHHGHHYYGGHRGYRHRGYWYR
jgi:hypothetical protein